MAACGWRLSAGGDAFAASSTPCGPGTTKRSARCSRTARIPTSRYALVNEGLRSHCCLDQNNRLNTALHLACERGHKDVIRTLIDNGASVDVLNCNKKLCWQVCPASRKRCPRVLVNLPRG